MVEPKPKMKARTGRSPDISDAVMLAIELCRAKHHWVSEERGEQVLSKSDYLQKIRRFDINTLSGGGHDWQPSF
jgi:hypothetical protein